MGLFYSEDENVVVHVSRIFASHILAVKLFVLPFYKESSCYKPITTGEGNTPFVFQDFFESRIKCCNSDVPGRRCDIGGGWSITPSTIFASIRSVWSPPMGVKNSQLRNERERKSGDA